MSGNLLVQIDYTGFTNVIILITTDTFSTTDFTDCFYGEGLAATANFSDDSDCLTAQMCIFEQNTELGCENIELPTQ